MSESEPSDVRLRREPPAFLSCRVAGVEPVTPRMLRVTLAGLFGLSVDEPAASVRLLFAVDGPFVVPTWAGNEFLLADGSRPLIRTLTPVRCEGGELDVDVVVHDGGALSTWAAAVRPGTEAAVSGPGRGYDVDRSAPRYFVAGDETALPAIRQVLAAVGDVPVEAHVEIAHPDARQDLEPVVWHDLPAGGSPGSALVEAVLAASIERDTAVWVAGEAAAVQRVRKHLFETLGLSRQQTTVRGYWKHGRGGE